MEYGTIKEVCSGYHEHQMFVRTSFNCVDVADGRHTFYDVNTLSDLFTNVAGDIILKFLIKEIKIYIYNFNIHTLSP